MRSYTNTDKPVKQQTAYMLTPKQPKKNMNYKVAELLYAKTHGMFSTIYTVD